VYGYEGGVKKKQRTQVNANGTLINFVRHGDGMRLRRGDKERYEEEREREEERIVGKRGL
jgi:hypothetical protein